MSKPAISLFAFGVYCIFLGLTFLLIPNLALSLFQLPATTEPWIRVMGVLIGYLGVYYMLASRAEMRRFIQWTVYARASLILVFGGMVLAGIGQATLILFASIDLLAAIWTEVELRRTAPV